MKSIQIKDLYAGKPDAKDEITFDGLDDFIKTYVVAENFDIDSLVNGSKCFITGFKGTGKTALLFFLDDKLKTEDQSTCSSFIFFKEDFAEIKRKEMSAIAHRIMTSITVEGDALLTTSEFEYIWRWLIYKRIISDNEEYGRNLFVDDEAWHVFEKTMKKIVEPRSTSKMRVPKKIKLAMPVKDPSTHTEITPEIEIDLSNSNDSNFGKFVDILDDAETAFMSVQRTDIPYFIFVDELEAYYGDESIFKRDLMMIRDLVFSVKRFNSMFNKNGFAKTKMICSVRSEILNAISRFIVAKEINKVTSGFSVPLNWNYTNSNSYAHPIIQIILKRIAVCADRETDSMLSIYNDWFPEQIHGIEPASYILNNSWCKPRDMVRLIISAQNSLQKNSEYFSQAVFDSLAKEYSEESLIEIKEELRALYKADQIDTIISCFTGFKTTFSYSDIQQRVAQYYPNTVLEKQLTQILEDLFRLGFLGNYYPATKSYHWQHKGDGRLIISDEWRLFVHYALHRALALRTQNDKAYNRKTGIQAGDVVHATATKLRHHFAIVSFSKYGTQYNGQIHISEFRKLGHGYINRLSDVVAIGDEFEAAVKDYSEKNESWNLSIIAQD